MLIRVSGGKGGIKEYLENGVKNGRDYSRDELDERVVLDGDLELTNDIIKTMETEGEKYLHVTLSFKEDHIDESTLNAVSQEFKAFAMKAYHNDEYAFYAEAHLPKIKSYVDKSSGETVERKPHIHVVIPEKNLLTGKRLEPFGLIKSNEHFIDAFQEVTNEKHQLASPKHHVRTSFTDESNIISRHKADLFPAQQRETKTKALEVLLSGDITTTAAFAQQLEASGFDVKIRNQCKDNEYLNIKSPEQKRGVNLKDNVFQPQFVALPKSEKLKHLDSQYNPYRENGDARYQATPKHHQDLTHWHQTRAFELRYVNRRNRAMYNSLTKDQKAQFLTDKRKEYGQSSVPRPSFDDINQSIGAASQYLLNAQRHSGQLESGVRNFTHRRAIRAAFANLERHAGNQSPPVIERASSERLAQIRFDLQSRTLPDVKDIKRHIDATVLLQRLSTTHGVDVDKYTITKGKDGSGRIQCGNRHLNVSDFLTKEMHMPWKEAKAYLEDGYLAQKGIDPKQAVQKHAEPNLIQAAWRSQLQIEREQKQTYLAQYRLEKQAIFQDKTLTKEERNVALSIAQMNKVIQDLRFKHESREAREQLRQPTTSKETIMREATGIVVSRKDAPYQHNPNSEMSYVVTLEHRGKTQEVWGKDLKHTLDSEQIKQGDAVTLTKQGSKAVTVEVSVPQADDSDKKERKEVLRHDWSVTKHSEKEWQKMNKDKVEHKTEKTPPINSAKYFDKHLQASRLLIHFPKLKELGINAESIKSTEKGDIIQFGEKQLSVTQLIKETHQMTPKQVIKELTPIYQAQEKDQARVLEYKERYMQKDRESISTEKEETKKPVIGNKTSGMELQIKPTQESEQKRKPIIPENNKFGEHITHNINDKGHVTYYQGKDKLITDRGDNILIEKQSNQSVEIGIRLAIEKYGTHLDVKGTKEYQQQVIDIAVKNKLAISFKDKALNQQLIERRAQFAKGENIITKAEAVHNSQTRQSEQTKSQSQAPERAQKTTQGWER